jgi:energy-coupling factor transporter ATP-binding protein EcfA2
VIRRLEVSGFKPFPSREPASFELGQLTVLVGDNGSGKTSVFETLGLLAQSAGQPGGFKWSGGEWVALPLPPACFHDRQVEAGIRFALDVTFGLDATRQELKLRGQDENLASSPVRYVVSHRLAGGRFAEWEHEIRRGHVWAKRIQALTAATSAGGTWDGIVSMPDLERIRAREGADSVLSPRVFEIEPGPYNAEVRQILSRVKPTVDAATDLLASHLRERLAYIGPERGPSPPADGKTAACLAIFRVLLAGGWLLPIVPTANS